MKNYYEILEVSPKTSKEIIEKAYKVLVKKYHPDLYQGEKRVHAEQKIAEINEAYRVLSDTFLKEQYDIELNRQIEREQINRYNRFYNTQKEVNTRESTWNNNQTENEEQQKYKVGTLMGMVDLLKNIITNRPKNKQKKKLEREDITAGVITAVIVVAIGVVLWFIPATRGFIRSLIPF